MLWRSTSRGPVLLAPDHDQPELLGGRAAVVWEVLDEPLTAEAITEAVLGVVGVTDDPGGAIAELLRLGFLDEQR